MNQPLFTFDARTVAPAIGFENWPGGWYPLMIRKSNLKTTQDGKGGYLELTVEAIDGPMKGQTNWIRLNMRNESVQAVEIAQKQLSAICHVLNVYNVPVFNVEDAAAQSLHNIPFQALCVITKNKETGRESNNWNGFKDMQGNQPGKANGPMQPQGQPQGSAPQAGQQQPQAPQWQAPSNPQGQPQAQPQQWGAPQGQPQAQPGAQPAPQWQQSPQGATAAPWGTPQR